MHHIDLIRINIRSDQFRDFRPSAKQMLLGLYVFYVARFFYCVMVNICLSAVFRFIVCYVRNAHQSVNSITPNTGPKLAKAMSACRC